MAATVRKAAADEEEERVMPPLPPPAFFPMAAARRKSSKAMLVKSLGTNGLEASSARFAAPETHQLSTRQPAPRCRRTELVEGKGANGSSAPWSQTWWIWSCMSWICSSSRVVTASRVLQWLVSSGSRGEEDKRHHAYDCHNME
ncbi:hypothetical protein E2562_032524 [Oryza meyeriana var. granulata]|uniref:Uncharacterized protein n=1 Tax=Oryza meyeriana var. granulata TaxID=110450 RepID=A0A6G1DQF5_9ORYZ|nr:hypothetical protein E2562_032524 [Oryza meyeriana var. granulata]